MSFGDFQRDPRATPTNILYAGTCLEYGKVYLCLIVRNTRRIVIHFMRDTRSGYTVVLILAITTFRHRFYLPVISVHTIRLGTYPETFYYIKVQLATLVDHQHLACKK